LYPNCHESFDRTLAYGRTDANTQTNSPSILLVQAPTREPKTLNLLAEGEMTDLEKKEIKGGGTMPRYRQPFVANTAKRDCNRDRLVAPNCFAAQRMIVWTYEGQLPEMTTIIQHYRDRPPNHTGQG